ncbi:hypothetical protein JTB14_025190 [Gonioctena quinquepunctata]|nr:hypothetical protein JTB14_025190 [Gonioctena quinquepunctata]
MEKGNNVKKEKVGPDGLTKKERRALKVQGRSPEENQAQNKKDVIVKEPTKVGKPSPEHTENLSNVKENPEKIDKERPSNKQLSEKELRKLEWENKLTEQKLKNEVGKETLSKAELKAKRREQQEAQRLAKDAQKPEPAKIQVTEELQEKRAAKPKQIVKKSPVKKEIRKVKAGRIQLVQHLYDEHSSKHEYKTLLPNEVHPAFVRLGVQYSNKIILGSNARCLALLSALKCLVDDLQTPPKQEFCRYLETILQSSTNYLHSCRALAVSMTNALRHFKLQLTHIDTNLKDNEKRVKLQDVIDTYINDDIKKAGDAISIRVKEKISNGDVILTYGCSSLIMKIILEAHKDGKKFEVVVVDGRPLLEGREMLRRLVLSGIKCTYVLVNALSYVMNNVTKVLLGAHALLTNGYVMSRIGTAQVAMVAKAYNKPVLVCCETYKFSERVQTDSFVINEIGDPNTLRINNGSEVGKEVNNHKSELPTLNLLYDVTPPDLVTAVVTELAILPCTSVPVVLRINLLN